MRHILVLAAALFALAWPSYAQEAAEESSPTPQEEAEESLVIYPRSDGSTTQTDRPQATEGLFSTSSTSSLLLSLLGAWFLFKRGFLKKPFSKGEGKLKVAESRMLGNRQFLMVVEYEDNKILLGVGPGKIDYLTSLDTYRNEFPSLESQSGKNLSEIR